MNLRFWISMSTLLPFLPRRKGAFGAGLPAALVLASLAGLPGCGDHADDPHDHNEAEVFTTVSLTLVNEADTADTVRAMFKDPDGDRGIPPVLFDSLKLGAGRNYRATLTLLDESKTPAVDMTAEVEEEGTDHQVFYAPTTGLHLTVHYRDKDAENRPLGIETHFMSGNASEGFLRLTLKHQPGMKSATSTASTGETDVEVAFPVVIR